MLGSEIRRKYIEFFESQGHLHLPSDSLVPNDPTLLFTSAGMVQFKPYFMGTETPPRGRAVTAQKCMRTDDIEEVGDSVHHTFFEMMGNFSFGDYFKREAIHFAWEFMTEWLHLPADRLWTSVYLDDDEAAGIWENDIGLPAERIVRLGADKNYWPPNAPTKGPNGPCGPCNEIFLDMSPEAGRPEDPAHAIAYDSNRFVEIWNLVFMQFLRGEGGTLTPLPRPNIDTGLGLERVAAIMQGVESDYDTDLFKPLIEHAARLTGTTYGANSEATAALRIIADHTKSAVFCIADGVMPSNIKRGYVLRRMIRRAVVQGRRLGSESNLLSELAPTVAEMMKDGYPELQERMTFVQSVLRSEEEKFARTLSTGMSRIDEDIRAVKASSGSVLSGDTAFTLYDTYGFPLELTEELCAAEGITCDREGFEKLMEDQRRRAREGSDIATELFAGAGDAVIAEIQKLAGKTGFAGYTDISLPAAIVALVHEGEIVDEAPAGCEVQIVLDRSPFYAESGGQVGDTGTIAGSGGSADVASTVKAADVWLHQAKVTAGSLKRGDTVTASVDAERRMAIRRNHTATHLLHAALRKTLGEHVAQAGSLVSPERLRFDFSHFKAMTPEEVRAVEEEVNRNVLADLPVSADTASLQEARERGAMALFGEKYGDTVRMISVDDVSLELCGGTHLDRTSQVGLMKIVSEGSVAAGVRRIEALTGKGALEHVRSLEEKLQQAASALQVAPAELLPAVERLQSSLREHQQALQQMRSQSSAGEAEQLVSAAVDVDGFKAVVARTSASDHDAMSQLADILTDRLGSSVVVLGSDCDGKVLFVSKVSKDLVGRGLHAGNIIKGVAQAAGGGGGGRPEFAKAGGKDPAMLDSALAKGLELIRDAAGQTGG